MKKTDMQTVIDATDEKVITSIEQDLEAVYGDTVKTGICSISEPALLEKEAKKYFAYDTSKAVALYKAGRKEEAGKENEKVDIILYFVNTWKQKQIDNKTAIGWLFVYFPDFYDMNLSKLETSESVDEIKKSLPRILDEKLKLKLDKLVADIIKYNTVKYRDVAGKRAFPSEMKVFDKLCDALPFQYGTHLIGRGTNSRCANTLFYYDSNTNTLYLIEATNSGYKGDINWNIYVKRRSVGTK